MTRRPRVLLVLVAFGVSACSGLIADPRGDESGSPGSSGGPGTDGESCDTCVGASQTLRLTRVEYERTVRAALGDARVDGVRFDHLPSDGSNGPFSSNAFFSVDEDSVEAYRAVAEAVGQSAAADADALLACDGGTVTAACTEAFLRRLGTRFYRRPLEPAEVTAYATLFETASATGGAADGVRLSITAMLQSPFFLYRIERGLPTVRDGVNRLTDHEVATRLGYFLWKSAPDDALLAAAEAGELSTAEGVRAQARRMLDDPRADFAIMRFHTEWLGVAGVTTHSVDESRFPEFIALRDDMLAETEQFTLQVFRQSDASLATLLTAPYTIASPGLAELYGASASGGADVDLDPAQRAGVLTHASFLTAHVNDPTTAAVHRGRTIRESFLCQELPLPPPVDTIIAPDASLSTRQKLEAKTSPPSCAACHRLMNPLGFAFEHFDAIGRWRDMDGEHVIDATGEVEESDVTEPFDGAVELAGLLAESEQVHRCVARQWLRFALGRREAAADELSLEQAYEAYEASGRDLRELLVAITATPAFRHRALP